MGINKRQHLRDCLLAIQEDTMPIYKIYEIEQFFFKESPSIFRLIYRKELINDLAAYDWTKTTIKEYFTKKGRL